MRTFVPALVLVLAAGCRGYHDDTAVPDSSAPVDEVVLPDALPPPPLEWGFPEATPGAEPLPDGAFSGSFQELDDGPVWGSAAVTTGGYEVRVRVDAHGLRPGMHYGVAFYGFPSEIHGLDRSQCPEPGTAIDAAATLGENLYEVRPLFRAGDDGALHADWRIYASDAVRETLPLEERSLVLFNLTGWTHDWRHEWIGCATIRVAADGR